MVFLFAFLACSEPTLQERWDSSFLALMEESPNLPPVEQLYLARKVLEERPNEFQKFCAFNHTSEVEFECSNILKRPHLLGQQQKRKVEQRSKLWDIQTSKKEGSLKETTRIVQKAALASKEEVAKECNAFQTDYLRYECYFIAADVLHQHHNQARFERMLAFCEASGFYLSFCLSHIQHRFVFPHLGAPMQEWVVIEEKLDWLSKSEHRFSSSFSEELAVYLSMRIMMESSQLCMPAGLENMKIYPYLRDAYVIVWVLENKGKTTFEQSLPALKKSMQQSCGSDIRKTRPRNIPFSPSWHIEDAKQQEGESRLYLDRQRRLVSSDSDEDLAISLVEAAGVLNDRFLVREAISYPSDKVVRSAKRIEKYFQ